MVNDLELKAIREQHERQPLGAVGCSYCNEVQTGWPCLIVRLADEIDRLRLAVAESDLDYAIEGGCGPAAIQKAQAAVAQATTRKSR